MRIINKIIFALLFSAIIFSCNTRKIGYFNNHYERYQPTASAPSASNNLISKTEETKALPKAINNISNKTAGVVSKYKEVVKPEFHKKVAGIQSHIGATRLAKKAIKNDIKQALKSSKESRADISNLLLVIIAILLPPLAVLLVDGLRGPFWLDILLTLLFYIPGLIYAIFRIFRNSNQ